MTEASSKYRALQAKGLWRLLLSAFIVVACAGIFPAAGLTQPLASNAAVSGKAATPVVPPRVAPGGPTWAELTLPQQQALKPLTATWHTISVPQKRKWLEISKNYPSLPSEGQATMHSRMNEWVTLSPQQRAQARLNFAKTNELSVQLTSEEKKAKWESYQALSPEEKKTLAARASPKPNGAATAVKPVSPQKLAAVPTRAVKPAAAPTAPPLVPAIKSMPSQAV